MKICGHFKSVAMLGLKPRSMYSTSGFRLVYNPHISYSARPIHLALKEAELIGANIIPKIARPSIKQSAIVERLGGNPRPSTR